VKLFLVPFCSYAGKPNFPQMLEKNGGDDETRTRDLCRDSPLVVDSLEEASSRSSIADRIPAWGKAAELPADTLLESLCVSRCVPLRCRENQWR
jgi:hypothetical protein